MGRPSTKRRRDSCGRDMAVLVSRIRGHRDCTILLDATTGPCVRMPAFSPSDTACPHSTGGTAMTTQQPIRIGLIGANIHQGWSPRAHLPALAAHPDFDLSAVCTTRQESADEAKAAYDAGSAWDDFNRMLADADIEAATISLRVPSHYEPTTAALRAGKHTFTEWPLGRAPPRRLSRWPISRGNKASRPSWVSRPAPTPPSCTCATWWPTATWDRVMTCHVRLMREGVLSRDSGRTMAAGQRAWRAHPDHRLRAHHRRAVQRGGRVCRRGHRGQHPGQPPGTSPTPDRTCR